MNATTHIVKDAYSRTPLDLVRQYRHTDMAKVLAEHVETRKRDAPD
jgi:hypothetical protein